MKRTFSKALLGVVAGFLILFALRLGYGYWKHPDGKPYEDVSYYGGADSGFDFDKRNYASAKYEKFKESAPVPEPQAYDQKYEKIGTLASQTGKFDDDAAKVKGIIKEHNGLIQYEQQGGLKDHRYLHLAIGVPPANFDVVVDALKAVGKLSHIRIDKTDKTNEFQKLKALRTTLEDHLASLMTLKKQNGKIEEFMDLEERIQDINRSLQDLGVSLGEFDSQNEFCTVKFTLSEVKVRIIDNVIPLGQRLMVAFTWTVQYYAALLFILFIGITSIFIVLKAIDMVKNRWMGRE